MCTVVASFFCIVYRGNILTCVFVCVSSSCSAWQFFDCDGVRKKSDRTHTRINSSYPRTRGRPAGGGGGGSLTIRLCYAPRVQKSVERGRKGSVSRYTASSTFLLKKVFFPSLSPFRGPISQSRFRGVFDPFRHLVVGIIWKIDHQ